MTVPAPLGLPPPAPIVVVPGEQPGQRPESSSDREPAPALTAERRPECVPILKPHLGGNALHDRCADNVPQNDARGFDVLVNGKHFDALQRGRRMLWEIKTDSFDTHTAALQTIVIEQQVPELQRERELARACGYEFSIGVRSVAHRVALRRRDPSLEIVVMNWC
jgi:hypothetical protein